MGKFFEKYYFVKLTKIQSTDNNIQTVETIGYSPYLPAAKEPFVIFAKGIADGALRVIRTSPVQDFMINTPEEISFGTLNSSYHLHILDEVSPIEVDEFINSKVSKNNPAIDQFMAKLDVVEPKSLN